MKTIASIFILFTIAYNTTFAQTDFEFKVLEENRSMTKGNANASRRMHRQYNYAAIRSQCQYQDMSSVPMISL